jgi:ribonuclease P protein component
VRWYGRLCRSSEIAFVRRRGRRVSLAALTVFALAGPEGPTRVAVTVAKTVGNAVVRNRVRRRIRGALDALGPEPRARKLLFVAKPVAASLPFERLAQDVAAALGRPGGAP